MSTGAGSDHADEESQGAGLTTLDPRPQNAPLTARSSGWVAAAPSAMVATRARLVCMLALRSAHRSRMPRSKRRTQCRAIGTGYRTSYDWVTAVPPWSGVRSYRHSIVPPPTSVGYRERNAVYDALFERGMRQHAEERAGPLTRRTSHPEAAG